MFQINKQEPLKSERSENGDLSIHSIFYTIQGEGPYVGRPAVFIRLAGCNLQCPGCDTDYTNGAATESVDSVVTRAIASMGTAFKPFRSGLVVITGGEPFRQNIIPLIRALRKSNFEVQIETNGTLSPWGREPVPISPPQFAVVVSPKAGKVHEDLWGSIIAYKYVVNADAVSPDDGLPVNVLGLPGKVARPYPGYRGPVYVQPADEPEDAQSVHSFLTTVGVNDKNSLNMKSAIKSCMDFGYTLCIQTHKSIGLP